MTTQSINYECVRGHVTTVKAADKISVAIRCTCIREDGKVCKETAYYQPTDTELDAAAMEERNKPRKQVAYGTTAQQDMSDTCYPYGK